MDKFKLLGMLALGIILLGLSSGCAGTTRAVPAVQQNTTTRNEALLAPQSQPATQGSTLLHFDPSPAQVTVGDVAAVQLRLENVDNLYGIEVHLTFDASVVQVEDDDPSREGVQTTVGEIPHPEFIVQNIVDNFGGRLDYAVVQLRPRPPASGSGIVMTIHLRGVSEGSSLIHFTGAKLASPDGVEIPATLQDGSIVVGSAPVADTPTPPGPTPTQPVTPPPSPTAVPTQPPSPTSTPSAVTGCPTLYVVRSGDTVFAIARRFGISQSALVTANNLPASYSIQIGQLLIIPGVPGPTRNSHVVQAQETLYSIARHYGTSVETLAAVNQLPHPWHVRLGQRLLICPP